MVFCIFLLNLSGYVTLIMRVHVSSLFFFLEKKNCIVMHMNKWRKTRLLPIQCSRSEFLISISRRQLINHMIEAFLTLKVIGTT